MRVHIKTTGTIESHCWRIVKGFFFLVLVVTGINATLPGVNLGRRSGARTLLQGVICANRSEAVRAPTRARVVRVECQEGATVRAGDLIAELESTEVESELESTERRLRLAELRVSVVSPSESGAASQYESEQAASAARLVASIRDRKAAYKTSEQEAAYGRAKAQLGRVSALADRQLATAEELELARRNEQNELRNLQMAQATVARLGEDLEAALSQQRLVRLGANRTDPRVREISELELEQARKDYSAAIRKKRALRVVAPIDGAVLSGLARVGGELQAGQAVVSIGDVSRFEVEVHAAAAVARSLRPGVRMMVRLPTDPPQTVPGTVKNSALAADKSLGGYIVRIDVRNPAAYRDLVGMEVTVDYPHDGRSW